ncbi:hypothetical protein BV898_19820 [Hypsibius exemplaris]|uniref:Uncharacterized protein n=1 Tax=Hypsibius exemplaris TaxID=2072580 RepID=A0A9X6NM91_HYPEX|nr:hypothetical protein BV898_19820 [Hypsibius exemplaris]
MSGASDVIPAQSLILKVIGYEAKTAAIPSKESDAVKALQIITSAVFFIGAFAVMLWNTVDFAFSPADKYHKDDPLLITLVRNSFTTSFNVRGVSVLVLFALQHSRWGDLRRGIRHLMQFVTAETKLVRRLQALSVTLLVVVVTTVFSMLDRRVWPLGHVTRSALLRGQGSGVTEAFL